MKVTLKLTPAQAARAAANLEATHEAVRLANRDGWSRPEVALTHFGERLAPVVRAAKLPPAQAAAEFDADTVQMGRRLRHACTGVAEFWRTAA